ncbi:MAG: response regulator [Chlorobi bacterium]|nr:response regulator [Chlorobiota bacterium]
MREILVVDDSSTNVVLLNAVLEQYGFRVSTALNVREAHRYLEKKKPDLILLDLLMPVTSGFEFLEEIKGTDHMKDIPVVIVSAVGTRENKEQTKNMGAVSFISKPVNINELLTTVRELLN